ncbi:hypothetical protein A1D31_35690 [Bradyrhizobium liaoningense]|nr:hypothetical protein A1D31_35690 [Bradyrhizobium liaoningense]
MGRGATELSPALAAQTNRYRLRKPRKTGVLFRTARRMVIDFALWLFARLRCTMRLPCRSYKDQIVLTQAARLTALP